MSPSPNARPVIQVEHLTKRFGEIVAVDDLSFTVLPGTATALLGGNGAGKTTTLAMLLGLLLPTSGRVTVLGEDIARHRRRVLPRMNFSSPYVEMPRRLTVEENLMVYAHLYGVPRARTRVRTLAEELDMGTLLHRKTATLSAGQRSRLAIAKSLLNEPDLLLLDEPTASLDPDTADRIRVYLQAYQQRSGASILLASHNMVEVERLCHSVLMMRGGRLVDSGSPPELIARYGRRTLEEVFLDIARADAGPARLEAAQ
jgi:ABC-2 type transport system ATP-binding protein